MAERKYSRKASEEVGSEMHRYKSGSAKSGKGGKVKSRKQAVAIGLSKARKKGEKVPERHYAVAVSRRSVRHAPDAV
jgi:hypothetical protein